MTVREQPLPRDAFPVLKPMETRWMDNDMYGHVNNVVYYAFFDTAVNAWLIEQGVLGPAATHNAIGLVVETNCQYFSAVSFPDRVTVGIRVERIGTSSVRYLLAVFRNNELQASAQGRFIHVYVDRETRRPVDALPDGLNERLRSIFSK
ncbi:acyl-CoA thioesterase [Burkholderia sp. 22PA0099]|uniref:acyl-CoA thioesterase n=1 Tax=Burkholderia sp. 22PA0099 TaxID=3237372 RepID=UPI0039C32444